MHATPPPRAILLLGPTGAGKSPFGDFLAAAGLRGCRCLHFDFGHHLRSAAAGADYGLSPDQLATIRSLLATNALLPDDQFPIAAQILRTVLARATLGPHDWLVLNGLPRHAQQVSALRPLADVRALVVLTCPADVVHQRIASNAGGDRATRDDDSPAEIQRKLDIFRRQTAPLIDYYRALGARIHDLPVGPATTPKDLYRALRATAE